jgi:hypothetical protein
MSAHDLAAEVFIANAWCVEAEQVYGALRRRGLPHRKADAIAGHSKCERAFERAADRRLAAEDAILRRKPQSLADLQYQIAVLAHREERGLEVSTALAKIAAALLTPGSLTDR